jgi:hypothetical protein
MEPVWFDCRLRLEDRRGHKRWLTTGHLAHLLTAAGGFERESSACLELELRSRLEPGEYTAGLHRFLRQAVDLRPDAADRASLWQATLAAIERHRLVVVREAPDSSKDPAARRRVQARGVVRDVRRLSSDRLTLDGRAYSLHARGGFDPATLGLTRQQLPPQDAVAVLTRLIDRAETPELADRLRAAIPFVEAPKDARGPELVLLRHLVQVQVRGSSAAPVTPSQLKPAEVTPAVAQPDAEHEPNRDAAAQADALIGAAKDRKAFCEECAKAAQQAAHDN